MDSAAFPSADEQQRILQDASTVIKRNAFHMRKAIEEDNMRDSLKHAAAMLGELRTSQLQPQKYYELYMLAFDQLSYLESFFADERGKGRAYSELYELVQHAGNVLPRLYLMVAVGCLYIKSHEASPRDVLKDLVEMCKGVQHPTRGLFLRAYLCQRAKGLLPDTGSEFEGPAAGSIHDALDFLMTNFIEMNKLWVRLQHQGSARDKEKRERERQQLQDLVGKNLTYLSQLDGLSFELYRDQVLPRVLDQITSCKDDLAQLYLMQALIQGFPDRFHLGTLESLLGVLPQLQPGVKVHSVMAALMDRLARYASNASASAAGGGDPRVLEELAAIDAFSKFKAAIAQIIASQPNLPAADAVEMYVALLSYAGSVHPGQLAYVDEVLAAAHAALGDRGPGLGGDARAERQLVALLSVPLAKYGVDVALGLKEYPPLTRLLRYPTHKELAVKIVQRVLEAPPPGAAGAAPSSPAGGSPAPPVSGGCVISDVSKVKMLFRFIAPLVADPDMPGEAGGAADLDDEDLDEEQVLVARLLHHLRSDDPDNHFTILSVAHDQLLAGGPRRLRTTLPSLVFCGLALHRRLVTARAAAADGGSAAAAPAAGAAAGKKAESKKEAAAAAAAKKKEADEKEEEEKKDGEKEDAEEGKEDGKAEKKEEEKKEEPAPAPTAPAAPLTPPKLTSEQLLQFLLAAIGPLYGGPAGQPVTALRLLLAAGYVASEEARLELLAYTFFEEAIALYDEALPDQRSRATGLFDIIGGLQRCRVFGSEHRDALTAAATAGCMRLVARREQCRALCAAAWLWWQAEADKAAAGAGGDKGLQPPVRDGAKVVATLQRAAKVAGQGKAQWGATGRVRDAAYLGAYVEVADAMMRLWDAEVPGIDADKVQALLDTVQADIAAGVAPDAHSARRWASTLAHIASQAAAGATPAVKERYGKLKAPPAPPAAARGSGTTTPASSVAHSVAPSEPGSPRTLSSHALSGTGAGTAGDKDVPHPPAPPSPSPAGRVSGSGSTSGRASHPQSRHRADDPEADTAHSSTQILPPLAGSPGLGAALQSAGVAAAGAAGAARDAAAEAADVVASVLPGGVMKPGVPSADQKHKHAEHHKATMKAQQQMTEKDREQRHLEDKAAAAAEAALFGRGAIARFTAPEQDGPAASVLMPPGVSGGGLAAPPPPGVVGNIPAAPLTTARPVPLDLPDYMDKPGEPHVVATPDRFHPTGSALTPPESSGLTSLQQHFAFFDLNKDGIITPWECVNGFRYLLRRYLPEPLNTLACIPVAAAVQLPLSWLTSDSWLPDPLLRVQVKNAHKVIHGSNSRAWDRSGRFTPARFEALLSKYDADRKGGLNAWEVAQMVRGQANLGDLLGTMASAGEWAMTWALLCDSSGVLRREDMRGMYDGTAFYRAAARNGYSHYTLETGRAPAVAKGYA